MGIGTGQTGSRRLTVVVTGIGFIFLAAAAPARAALDKRPRKASVCSADVCFLTAATDSDGDGVADVDEVEAGTDPRDPRSYPGALVLLELAGHRKLPSLEKAFTTIVVLPTTAPDGTALFGGELALPGRKSALEKLGLTSTLLKGFDLESTLLKGVDLKRGLTLTVGEAGLTPGSLAIARLGPGGSPTQAMSGTAGNVLQQSPNNGSPITSTSVTGNEVAGTAQVNHADGSFDQLGWQVGDDGMRARATYTNKDGYKTGTTTYKQETHTGADGTTTTTSTTHTETNRGSSTTTTTTESNGGQTYGHSEYSGTTNDGEGNTTTTNSSSTTSVNEDGEVWTHTSTATTTCDSSNSCSTTMTDSSGGTRCDQTPDDCAGGSDTAYRDPDYMEVTPSPEVVATALIVFNSRLDYYHDPTNDSSEPITLPPADPQDVAPYILVTGDPDDAPAIIDGDFFYTGGVQPDYDPTLENPLYDDPKDPNECLECR